MYDSFSNFLLPKKWPCLPCLILFWTLAIRPNLDSNPIGLIDDFALGLSRSETPTLLEAKRDTVSAEPFLLLQQSGNIIFQVKSNGNIYWSGALNRDATTMMGNLYPAQAEAELGSPENVWKQLYSKHLFLPLTQSSNHQITSARNDATLEKLAAYQAEQSNAPVQLGLKPNPSPVQFEPEQILYYNIGELLALFLKRLQDDQERFKQINIELDEVRSIHLQQTFLNQSLQSQCNTLKDNLELIEQNSNKRIEAIDNELKIIKNQLKFLTTSVQDKLNPNKPTEPSKKDTKP